MSFFSNIMAFENPWDNSPKKTQDQQKNRANNENPNIDELFKKSQEKLLKLFSGGKHGNSNSPQISNKLSVIVLSLIAFFIWLGTGFYTIDTDQEGVVMRFGKYNRNAKPGLNYKLPSPLETVDKVSVTRINKEVIGLKASSIGFAKKMQNMDEAESFPKESQMLTADENIVDMHFFVQWYIKNATDYLFNIKDDSNESTIRVAAESTIRQVVGRFKIAEALSEQRQEIENRTKAALQSLLDSYKSGIEVVNVGILYSYVAPEVRDAYRDIQSAKADRERSINEAQAYRNDIIPKARGQAQAIIEEAKAYKDSTIAVASGESKRFNDILTQYQKSKEVTRERMYIESMEKVLKDVNKVVVDKSVAGKSVPFFSINELTKK